MATIAKKQHSVKVYPGCGSLQVLPAREAASQSYKAGDLVYFVAGLLTAVATDGTSIAGIAMEDATGTTNAATTYAPLSDCIIEMNTTEASAPGTKYIQAIVGGTNFGLTVTSGQAYCDLDDTTNDAVVVLALLDAVGDAYGRVLCKVLAAADQSSIGT